MDSTVHPQLAQAHRWSGEVVGAAIEVHRTIGPGLLESIYQRCLQRELQLRKIPSAREVVVPIIYKDLILDETLRPDFWIDSCLVVEAKAVEKVLPIHVAQILTYMRLLNGPVGLLLNFHALLMKDGIRRVTLKNAEQP